MNYIPCHFDSKSILFVANFIVLILGSNDSIAKRNIDLLFIKICVDCFQVMERRHYAIHFNVVLT